MSNVPLNICQRPVDSHLRLFIKTTITKIITAKTIRIITNSKVSGITEGLVCSKFVGEGEEVGVNDGEMVVEGKRVGFVRD